jgi:hypothetical protein
MKERMTTENFLDFCNLQANVNFLVSRKTRSVVAGFARPSEHNQKTALKIMRDVSVLAAFARTVSLNQSKEPWRKMVLRRTFPRLPSGTAVQRQTRRPAPTARFCPQLALPESGFGAGIGGAVRTRIQPSPPAQGWSARVNQVPAKSRKMSCIR